MAVSAIDVRYSGPMNAVFDEENKLARWLEVEAALAMAHAELGDIPREAATEIARKANVRAVKLERAKEIESQVGHDMMAVVKALSEKCAGGAGGFVHLGATSYDIEDTATALIFRDALALYEKRLAALKKTLMRQAALHKHTVCIGRTHGQHAVPTTYGLKFAVWACEVDRHLERLGEARKRILVGKMTGAVGTMATFGNNAFRLQASVMKLLGLKPVLASTQVIQRDRHAEIISLLSLSACTCEKIAKEIRNLQRTEIMEVAEPFGKTQVGSSTMPHKRNPHKSERVCSLARVVRSGLQVAMENIALEHERDLTNSANERIIFPESFILTDYVLAQTTEIVSGLEFFPERIACNLKMSRGLVMAERLMVLLTRKGMNRQEAHELLREASRRAIKNKVHLKAELSADPGVLKYLSPAEIGEAFKEESYVGKAVEIVERALKSLS
ncbi:MAG: adenylosuccinate lyase [Candidatus ainarchaeum sp.]|nr:adenylosuccinate lyase [Candidatus ainarchaeum sp.]